MIFITAGIVCVGYVSVFLWNFHKRNINFEVRK